MKKYVRFCYNDEVSYGILTEQVIHRLAGNSLSTFALTDEAIPQEKVVLLPPCEPSKIIGTGLNYSDIQLSPGESLPEKPKLFIKPPSTLITDGEEIVQPPMVKQLSCEVELAIVIGKTAKCVSLEEATAYIWGYTVVNDVTASDLQKEDVLWARSKSFDTFLPVAPCIVSDIDFKNLLLTTTVNHTVVQQGCTNDMIKDVPWLVSYISHIMTLLPGDMIITGTPTGYGSRLHIGDVVKTEIRELGSVTNTVAGLQNPYYY